MVKEYSAGGIVVRSYEVLIILMNTISGFKVWTFPKGHIENGETPKDAALREVFEETGVKCKIIDDKEFFINNYIFTRNNNRVFKTVYWYLMEPLLETGKIETPTEIDCVKWVDFNQALEMFSYESDKRMIKMLQERFLKK